jgi:hypothetical protein
MRTTYQPTTAGHKVDAQTSLKEKLENHFIITSTFLISDIVKRE